MILFIKALRSSVKLNEFSLKFLLCCLSENSWEIVHNKTYQTMETVTSSVRTKVKGDGFFPINAYDPTLNKSDPEYYHKLFQFNPKFKYRMIDSGDYVIPPNEYNSLFIMTKFIKTEQVLDYCKRVRGKKFKLRIDNSVC